MNEKELFDQIIQTLDLNEQQRKALIPSLRKNRSYIIRIIKDYGQEQFEKGKNGSIDFLQT